jgi:hypothetical protein
MRNFNKFIKIGLCDLASLLGGQCIYISCFVLLHAFLTSSGPYPVLEMVTQAESAPAKWRVLMADKYVSDASIRSSFADSA